MARFWGVGGELSGWDMFRGCSGGSGGVSRRFWVAVRGLE
jgi:hypothetical protein